MDIYTLIRDLLGNAGLRAAFLQDPQGTLHEIGLDNATPEDIHDAITLACDDQSADFSRNYDFGHNSFAPPPPPMHHDYATPAASHEAAAQYLNSYITNNYATDNSINQQIDTHGGDFDQDLDIHNTTANGDGAVAVGGDVDHSPIVTGDGNSVGNVNGDGNVVGDGNDAVTGDHSTGGFGTGATVGEGGTNIGGNVTVGEGGAFGSGGSTVQVDNSTDDHSTTTTSTDDHSVNTEIHTDNTWNDDHSINHSINHSFDHDSDVHFDTADLAPAHVPAEPMLDHAAI
jgi:hypothetical protein